MGWVAPFGLVNILHCVTGNPDQLSLAINLWVLAMVMATARKENGKFCLALGHATRTADMSTQLKAFTVKLSQPSCQSMSHASLIGFNPC